MKEHIKDYRARLEKEIGEYLALPAGERSAKAIDGMLDCWEHIREVEKHMCGSGEAERLTAADLEAWNAKMKNVDGTRGGHWTVAQTSDVAAAMGIRFDRVTPEEWNATMNMMFSDYYPAAARFGVEKPDFYAELAKDFLFDPDGGEPEEKLAEYYRGIVG